MVSDMISRDGAEMLQIVNLKKTFPVRTGFFSRAKGFVNAVDDVSFTIKKQETMGLVGESGCGKTTLGRCILRLIEATGGQVLFEHRDLMTIAKRDLRKLRKEMQIVFQNPYASLDPRMTVYDLIAEPIRVHKLFSHGAISKRVMELLKQMNLESKDAYRYPHEFSGGQRQRIAIARALSLNPRFIVLDEPTSALDISVQAQILALLRNLQADLGLTYLFISHNLAVIRAMSHRVAVMYVGRIVELAECDEIFDSPLHPYTEALISAEPNPDPQVKHKRTPLQGDIPSPINPPSGCPFHTRCPQTWELCREQKPQYLEVSKGHYVACHLRVK
ncbi:peptide ABC transporter substrate-binding protein [Candidatus Bathyarchaeota archaeon RBG_13_46_16b]|nr:MAG: peptide ABC transporter substrate-binding protein [Candidatus Bathyarchaeota archaeon RBG_13_46_16b]